MFGAANLEICFLVPRRKSALLVPRRNPRFNNKLYIFLPHLDASSSLGDNQEGEALSYKETSLAHIWFVAMIRRFSYPRPSLPIASSKPSTLQGQCNVVLQPVRQYVAVSIIFSLASSRSTTGLLTKIHTMILHEKINVSIVRMAEGTKFFRISIPELEEVFIFHSSFSSLTD